jgi:hypothetical protein
VTRKRYLAAAALVAVAAGAAVALVLLLGNGKHHTTRKDYLARVSAICRDYNGRLARIPAPIGLSDPRAIARSISRALPLVQARAAAARAVQPPEELRRDVGRMFRLSDRAIGELRNARQAALAGEVRESALAVGRFLEVSDEAHAIAVRIGLDC